MLVLIAMGVVTDVARSKRLSTRDPPLTVVPSPTDPLLVLLADGTVQQPCEKATLVKGISALCPMWMSGSRSSNVQRCTCH